ncbi:MAG: hypothetical protein LBU39_08195 [Desulfobulbaceae bacterium]|jgi:hypothetical protein|nr:hypothetical protein [Desulfobulbaceae bacterium]
MSVQQYLLQVLETATAFDWFWRLLVLVCFVIWSCAFLFTGFDATADSFLHGVNLVFHKAGHVIFSFAGRFMAILGGTLGQSLMLASLIWGGLVLYTFYQTSRFHRSAP